MTSGGSWMHGPLIPLGDVTRQGFSSLATSGGGRSSRWEARRNEYRGMKVYGLERSARYTRFALAPGEFSHGGRLWLATFAHDERLTRHVVRLEVLANGVPVRRKNHTRLPKCIGARSGILKTDLPVQCQAPVLFMHAGNPQPPPSGVTGDNDGCLPVLLPRIPGDGFGAGDPDNFAFAGHGQALKRRQCHPDTGKGPGTKPDGIRCNVLDGDPRGLQECWNFNAQTLPVATVFVPFARGYDAAASQERDAGQACGLFQRQQEGLGIQGV